MAMISYQYLSGMFIGIISLKLNMKLQVSFNTAVITKRCSLAYSHVENSETYDLASRTCYNCVESIMRVQNNLLSAISLVIQVASILSIIMAQVWWAGIASILISIPLFFIVIKAGKTNYEANKEAYKHTRRADYLHQVLLSRDNIEERTMFSYTNDINKKWYEKYEIARKINLKVTLKNFIKMKSSSIITIFLSLIIIGFLLISLGKGTLGIGLFIGLVTGVFNLVGMMSWQLSWIASEFANSHEYLKDLTKVSKLSEKENALSFHY